MPSEAGTLNHIPVDYLPITKERLLLHTETSDGSVIPIWEEVRSEDVAVLKDVMARRKTVADGVELASCSYSNHCRAATRLLRSQRAH